MSDRGKIGNINLENFSQILEDLEKIQNLWKTGKAWKEEHTSGYHSLILKQFFSLDSTISIKNNQMRQICLQKSHVIKFDFIIYIMQQV